MKPKILDNYSNNDYPYEIFFPRKYSPVNRRNLDKDQESLKQKFTNNQNITLGPIKTYDNNLNLTSTISKSLKTVTLSSNIYTNYINFYTKLTHKNSFKTPKATEYPLLKNEKYLHITTETLIPKETKNEKNSLPLDLSNSLFISAIKETNVLKKVQKGKKHAFKSINYKNLFDRAKSYKIEKDFKNLCEQNLFETKFLNKIGIQKKDLYNCYEEKQKNFIFFKEYIKGLDNSKDFFKENNFKKDITFNGKTAIKKENLEFKLDISSLCFKFYPLKENIDKESKKIKSQKLYFPYELMPFFYLLDFTSFKVFISEIITFNQSNNGFEYIKENLLKKKLKKYINFISNSSENNPQFINNITYNKKEYLFSFIYDWIVTNDSQKEEKSEINKNKKESDMPNNNYKCFKLKITLPKIKFSIENLNIKIIRYLNKHMIAKLLKNKFKNWEKFIFFDLFSLKKFKLLNNLIFLNKPDKFQNQKIHLNKVFNIHNKNYEFFLTQIGDDYSFYYTFVPYIILVLFGEKRKKFQKINMSLKESRNLYQFGKVWGMINTLFKCMFINTLKNQIFYKFDLLDDNNNELINLIKDENNKQNLFKESNSQIDNLNKDNINNNNSYKKIMSKNIIKRDKENIIHSKYKDKTYEILLLDCTFLKMNISSIKLEYKYYHIPSKILKNIFNIKDESKLVNSNITDIPLMSKYIGENCKSILSAKEADIISEEEKMIDKAEIKDEEYKYEKTKNVFSRNQNRNKLNTIQMIKNHDSIKNVINVQTNFQEEEMKLQKKNSDISVNEKENMLSKSRTKKISDKNLNEINQNRIEFSFRDFKKKKTFSMKNFN